MSADYDEQRMVVCDRKSAVTKTEDGLNDTWTNDFNSSLELKPGDRIAVYNSFIAEKGAGTSQSIEFKEIDLKSKTSKSLSITTTQILPAGDVRNNEALLPEGGYRTYVEQLFQNFAAGSGSLHRLQEPQVYMDYCENTDKSITMRDNEASLAINYYKTMDGLSYFQLPRRWAYDDWITDFGNTPPTYNGVPGQWSDFDGLSRGRARNEPVQISSPDGVGTTQIYFNLDQVVGYVKDDYKCIVDSRPDVAYSALPPVRGLTRQGRVEKVILKNDNSRYTILKRKKNLMYPPEGPTASLLTPQPPPINAGLYADFVPPYYAADPEFHDYLIYTDEVDLRVEPGFTSSQYVSEELTRQMRSLREDQNRKLERTPDAGQDMRTMTTIEQFIETSTYKRFASSNDYYGAERFFRQTLDNSAFVAPGNPVGFAGPTLLSAAPNIGFQQRQRVIQYLQQYQYIGCKRPELYIAGTQLNDIFGLQVVGDGGLNYYRANPLEIALPYNDANLLKLKTLMDAEAQYPELFSKENIQNLYKITVDRRVPSVEATNPYVFIKTNPANPFDFIEHTYVTIDNARFLHMNPHETHYYNNLLYGDAKLDANWRDYTQLGNGYYDFRGNLIVNPNTGQADPNAYSRALGDPTIDGAVTYGNLRFNSKPIFFYHSAATTDTLFTSDQVVDETMATENYTYGCFGRKSTTGNILIYPNKLLSTEEGQLSFSIGIPPEFFDPTSSLITQGRKIGFDRHFNAWSNACICLTSGIPRFEYQQTLDGTKALWGTETQYGWSGAPLAAPTTTPQGIYSNPLTHNNDLQPFLNYKYMGADAPALVYDGAHFSFKDLHTPLNKGNLNTLAAGDASGDEAQVVYKINPQQSFNNLTPTQLPYDETIDFSYTSTGAADETRRPVNRNLETFSVYDTTTGIFIQDFGFNEDVWQDSLWGRLGFTYGQFHNSNPPERQKRYTDFTDTSNLLTTNADVKSRDIKSWAQNKFGESQYTGVLFHPFTFLAYKAGTPATDSYLEFYPEIIAPTDSVSIVAKEYPTQINNGFYNIRSDIALNASAVLGSGDTGYPIVGIADKTNSLKDFFISSPSSISHTITRPVTIASITTSITDPDGTPSRCSPNSVVIYRVTRTIDTSYNILGDLEKKLAELEELKKSKK